MKSDGNSFRVVKVWHIGAWNRNVGDWALAYQMHRLLNEQAARRGIRCVFHLVDSQRTWFHPGLVDQLNEETDLVLIGGGGLIFRRPEDRSVSGWSFNIAPSELARIKPPLVAYAVGYNRFRFDPNEFLDETRAHLRQLQDRAALFSVRTHGTKRVLCGQFGLSPDKIEVVPDPGLKLYDRPLPLPSRASARPIIALNWAGDRPHYRYPPPAESNAEHFFSVMRAALLRCVEELRVQVMFLPHLLHVDSDCYKDFADGFRPGDIFSTHEEVPFLYPPPGEMLYPHVPFFTNLFRQADMVLGMRFHACVLAFGAGTRFMPVGSHPKVDYLLEDSGLPDYRIPLVHREEDTVERVAERIRSCLGDAVYRESVPRVLTQQIETLQAFNEKVLDVVEPRRSR